VIRTVVRRLAFALGFVLLLTLCSEVALRAFYPHPLVERYFRPARNSAGYRLSRNEKYQFFHNGRLINVETDDTGHRVVPGAPSDATCQIFVIGDSQVFGWGLTNEETIPARIQQKLGSKCRVINLGVPGYGPIAYAEQMRYLPQGAIAVVVQTEANDLQDAAIVHSAMTSRCGYLVSPAFFGQHLPCFVLSSYSLAKAIEIKVSIDPTLPTPVGFNPDTEAAARVLQYRVRNLYAEALNAQSNPTIFAVIPWDAAIQAARLTNYEPLLKYPKRLVDLPETSNLDAAFRSYSKPDELFQANDSHVSPVGADLVARVLEPQIADLIAQRTTR